MGYTDFRDAIEEELRQNPDGLSWAELKERLEQLRFSALIAVQEDSVPDSVVDVPDKSLRGQAAADSEAVNSKSNTGQ